MKLFFRQWLTALQKIELEVFLILILLVVWTLLIHLFEWIGYFDSLYFSVITLAGIGYGDIAPLTVGGKVVSMVYWLIGVPLFIIAWLLVIELLKWSPKGA